MKLLGKFLNWLGFPKLFVFLGDSHVVAFTDSKFIRILNIKFDRINNQNGIFISLWFRDTLAYNVSRGVYPKNAKRLALFLGYLRFVGAKFYFSFGEIDIRCHLAKVDRSSDFLNEYVKRCLELIKSAPRYVFFLTPTPPSDFYDNHPSFPRFGSLSDRIEAHEIFCENLKMMAKIHSCGYVNTGVDLTDKFGGLQYSLTSDGCHLNQNGSKIIRTGVIDS